MSNSLTDRQTEAIAELLYSGFIAIRRAAREGDSQACQAVSDLLHNVPEILTGGHQIEHWLDVDLEDHPVLRLDPELISGITKAAAKLHMTLAE